MELSGDYTTRTPQNRNCRIPPSQCSSSHSKEKALTKMKLLILTCLVAVALAKSEIISEENLSEILENTKNEGTEELILTDLEQNESSSSSSSEEETPNTSTKVPTRAVNQPISKIYVIDDYQNDQWYNVPLIPQFAPYPVPPNTPQIVIPENTENLVAMPQWLNN
ncbi:alpha-S1-casein-like [Tupaia chinensis]|uniref:alpha-S1-casein-like n=1 Tax=Tupaia chinensis TaxID=246437 RepID=UPI000FFBBA20|nr:alpha-S1-casein-like [Tupaia chinensis]